MIPGSLGITIPVALAAATVGAIGLALVVLLSLRRFEIAILLVLASTWMHWFNVPNVEIVDVEAVLEGAEQGGIWTFLRVGMVAVAGLIGYLTFLRDRRETGKLPASYILLAVFLVHALTSMAYSINPRFTLIRTTEFVAFAGFLLGFHVWLTDEERMKTALNLFCVMMIIALAVNLAAAGFAPSRVWYWRSPNRYQGLMGQPNGMGLVCMMSYLILAWKYRGGDFRDKALAVGFFVLAGGMQVLSGSRASTLAAGLGIVIWVLVLRQYTKAFALAGVCLLGLFFVTALPKAIPSLQREHLSSQDAEITDLTGRMEMWSLAFEVLSARPLFGYGYEVSGSVWSEPQFAKRSFVSEWGSSKTSLHNGYLDVAIGSGILGLVLWVTILFYPVPGLLRMGMSDTKAFLLGFLVQFFVLNFFESAISTSRSFGSLAFWMLWVAAIRASQLDAEAGAEATESLPGEADGLCIANTGA